MPDVDRATRVGKSMTPARAGPGPPNPEPDPLTPAAKPGLRRATYPIVGQQTTDTYLALLARHLDVKLASFDAGLQQAHRDITAAIRT
jgi:hypothetical protein